MCVGGGQGWIEGVVVVSVPEELILLDCSGKIQAYGGSLEERGDIQRVFWSPQFPSQLPIIWSAYVGRF